MNLGGISDKLPTYPSNIQGELRLILQTKDIFMVCYKQLEEYRRLVNEQNRLITKEFVQEQLQVGEDEITELKMEFEEAEGKLAARLRHNELLADQLSSQGFASLEGGGTARHMALVRSPQIRKQMMAQKKSNDQQSCSVGKSQAHMIDNIALAIDEIHQEVRTKVKPLLDYYRDLFYLQLHFSLVLGQVCNYCMPLVTENIGLLERVFFWAERPEFELIRKASDISDRLKEIYTRGQQILGVLSESVRFLQSKVELQKSLETKFHERMDEQQKIKDKILRDVHGSKQNMDMLEEENDRLVGSLVKIDPTFVASQNFTELAEGGSSTNKGNHPKHERNLSNTYFQENVRQSDNQEVNDEMSNIDDNAEYNNNKAMSIQGDSSNIVSKSSRRRKSRETDGEINSRETEKICKTKRISRNFGNDDVRSELDDKKTKKSRERKRNTAKPKHSSRSSTITVNVGEKESNKRGNDQGRKRSNSRPRSTSASDTSRKRPEYRKAIKTDRHLNDLVTSGRSSGLSQKADDYEYNARRDSNGSSFKSRLLDRTKGLFDSSKNSRAYNALSVGENFSEISNKEKSQNGVFTSVSSLGYSDFQDSSKSRRFKDEKVRGVKKEKKNEKRSKELHKLPQLDDELLILDSDNNERNSENSELNSSHSRGEKNPALDNNLAEFLASSASESVASIENSRLPKF